MKTAGYITKIFPYEFDNREQTTIVFTFILVFSTTLFHRSTTATLRIDQVNCSDTIGPTSCIVLYIAKRNHSYWVEREINVLKITTNSPQQRLWCRAWCFTHTKKPLLVFLPDGVSIRPGSLSTDQEENGLWGPPLINWL